MKQLRSYEEYLFEALKDKKEACAYLNAALMDEDPRVFLLALKDVIQAQGLSMSKLAEITGLKRENLYRIFSKKVVPTEVSCGGWGNPKLPNIISILNAAEMTLTVEFVETD